MIADYLTRRIRHSGSRNLLRTPEMKAKYPDIDNQPRLDSAMLDAAASDPRMVLNLFIEGEEPEVVTDEPATKMDAIEAIKVLQPFMSPQQMAVVSDAMRGEEKQFFFDKVVELADTFETMPKTYDQDGKGDDAVAYLHYFKGSGDWYITEKDMDGGVEQAFGLADIGYGGELGYISIGELVEAGVELDFHFTPRTLREIKGEAPEPEHKVADPLRYDPATNRHNGVKLTRGDILRDDDGQRYALDRDRGFILDLTKLTADSKPAGMVSVSVDPTDKTRYRSLVLTGENLYPTAPPEVPEAAPEVPPAAPEPPVSAEKQSDIASFQSIIDGTVADILAPQLADQMEAAYLRHQGDAEIEALATRAVEAYQAALLAATANV